MIQKTIAYFLNTRFWKSVIRLAPRLRGYPKFRLENYFKIRQILRDNPDEIFCFVGCDNHSVATILQRKFYKIYWAHSGFLSLGTDGEAYISHVRNKLRFDSLLYYLKEVDQLAIIKLPLSKEEKEIARQKINKIRQSKVRYFVRDPLPKTDQYASEDAWETCRSFQFYCSEYQYYVCRGMMDNPLWSLDRTRFSTDDLYKGGIVIFEE
jgi:hypothetical protein